MLHCQTYDDHVAEMVGAAVNVNDKPAAIERLVVLLYDHASDSCCNLLPYRRQAVVIEDIGITINVLASNIEPSKYYN